MKNSESRIQNAALRNRCFPVVAAFMAGAGHFSLFCWGYLDLGSSNPIKKAIESLVTFMALWVFAHTLLAILFPRNEAYLPFASVAGAVLGMAISARGNFYPHPGALFNCLFLLIAGYMGVGFGFLIANFTRGYATGRQRS